jgi:hypothetical protein
MVELVVNHIKGNAVKGVDSGVERVSLEKERERERVKKENAINEIS